MKKHNKTRASLNPKNLKHTIFVGLLFSMRAGISEEVGFDFLFNPSESLMGAPVSDSRFLGLSWFEGGSVGHIEDTPIGDFGAEISGLTSGRVGFNQTIRATGGDIAATVPVRLELNVPNAYTVKPTEFFSVTPDLKLGDGWGFEAHSPQLAYHSDFQFVANAFVSAEVCAFDCADTGANFGANKNVPLIDYNNNFDEKLRLSGHDATEAFNKLATLKVRASPKPLDFDNTPVDDSLGAILARIAVNPLPFMNVSAAANPATPTAPLTVSDSVDLVTATLDMSNLMANYIAPGARLNDSALGFSWNLLKAEAGLAVGVDADFTVQAPEFSWGFTVDEFGNAPFLFSNGEAANLSFLGHESLTLRPFVQLEEMPFSADIGLLLSPLVRAEALSVSGLGHTLGPLFKSELRQDFVLPLLTLDGHFDSLRLMGDAITLRAASISAPDSGGTLSLLAVAAGGLLQAGRHRFRRA